MPLSRRVHGVVLLSILASTGCSRPGGEVRPDGAVAQDSVTGNVHQDRRFSGYVRLRTAGGMDSVRMELINLDLRGGTTLDRLELAFEGTVIGYSEAGSVTLLADGKRQERAQGQIWTVPVGTALGFATGRDAASLQLVIVGRGGP